MRAADERLRAYFSGWPKATITVAWGETLSVIHIMWFVFGAKSQPSDGELSHPSDPNPNRLWSRRWLARSVVVATKLSQQRHEFG